MDFAPVGQLLVDGDRVCCHLCGRWFLSVASHLRHHGWTKAQYIEAFGLEIGNPLSGEATRKRRAAALTARRAVEPVIREAQRAARGRAGDGTLTAAAARAARGRAHPAERLAKTLAALATVDPAARAAGNRRRAERQRARTEASAAARFGFPTFAEYVADRLASGMSMAAVSREAGLHKDWVARHAPAPKPHHTDVRLGPAARAAGHDSVAGYLRDAHLARHRTVAAIAAEAGVSRTTVVAALAHHGIPMLAHAGKRAGAELRRRAAAATVGHDSIADWVAARRAGGATWSALAAESGLATTTLRRYAS
ncbi:MucR family transcriptional regulator [Dactylosporangium sucinum]|uniref:MucR family transcriptional regulator n=1 Tax=Dactylosporangium sucinum TaxID=1424081 RepID=UPI00167CC20E|nr:MucR family transcriptional regulator [Dactylosporangium sucinum]